MFEEVKFFATKAARCHYFSLNCTKIWTVNYPQDFESQETCICLLLKLLFYFYSNSSMKWYLLQSKTVHLIFRNLWLFTRYIIFKPFQAETYIIWDIIKMFLSGTDNELALTFLGWSALEYWFLLFPVLYLRPCQSQMMTQSARMNLVVDCVGCSYFTGFVPY